MQVMADILRLKAERTEILTKLAVCGFPLQVYLSRGSAYPGAGVCGQMHMRIVYA